MSVSKTFHALRSGSPTSDNPVKLPRRVRKSWMEMRRWVSPDQSLLDTQAHCSNSPSSPPGPPGSQLPLWTPAAAHGIEDSCAWETSATGGD